MQMSIHTKLRGIPIQHAIIVRFVVTIIKFIPFVLVLTPQPMRMVNLSGLRIHPIARLDGLRLPTMRV